MSKDWEKTLRPLYILRYLNQRTDSESGITEQEIHDMLLEDTRKDWDRRLIYDDIHALQSFGFDISKKGRPDQYCLNKRVFTLPELKILVDAVQSSRFITAEDSQNLIQKIMSFCSNREARELSRSVYVQNRIKTPNDAGYSNVDKIYSAINANREITFRYFNWDENKKPFFKKHQRRVSPFALAWSDENYYLIAWNPDSNGIRHYRVDKMVDLEMTDRPREGCQNYEHTNTAIYTSKLFGMFGGNTSLVRLLCENSMAGVMIDRFGTEPVFFKEDAEHFSLSVSVVPSQQFYGWILGLGNKVQILAPSSVVDGMRQHLEKVQNLYSGS
jgi:predicted DNA-binding transcriptional regulator YafY